MSYSSFSQVTRALRARLSYASYKATHNIPHVPLRDLEAQTSTQSQTASFSRTIAAKRKASGTNNYYNNPATQGPNGMGAGANSLRRGASGAMPPPTTVSSPRTHYPTINGSFNATTSANDIPSTSRNPNPTPSLYTSLLAPPPAKHARTIHNPSDPPVPAPSRPVASPRVRAKPSAKSIAEGTRAHAKSRQTDKTNAPGSPDRRRTKRPSADKGKRKQRATNVDVDADGDVDMKAAATLTSLLLHHRPSIAGSASSPRSSIDGSDAGSVYSYSHFAQSSARTTTAPVDSSPVSAAPSVSTITAEPSFRNQTPPPPNTGPALGGVEQTTPRPAPTDNEAADLMLFLATSPSPARPSNKDSKDLAAYRALGGGSAALRDKGRVLFPENPGPLDPNYSGASVRSGSTLARGGEGSFASSISSIGTDMGQRTSDGALIRAPIIPIPNQLLSPPPLPLASSASGSPSGGRDVNQSPKPGYNQGTVEFNFSDFIHASPSSPARGTVGQGHKGNLGLRADVGRKLFEEEQMRHALNVQNSAKRPEERGLGASIDLVQS